MPRLQGVQSPRGRRRRGANFDSTAVAASIDIAADRAPVLFDAIAGGAVFLGLLVVFLLKAPGLAFFMGSSDHGYQLSIGTQVLLGKVPGIDLVIAYGPLVMYTSALGLWLTHSLIGETILCSAGYAVSVFLLYHLVSRYRSKPLGLVAAGFGLLLQARFYKWYVWLIPMTILWGWHRYLNAARERRGRWVVAGGAILGVSWLYRPDFGTTNLFACAVFLGLVEASEPARKPGSVSLALGLLLASFSVFPLAWFAYLVVRVGLAAPSYYLETTVQATRSIVSGMSQPPPPIRSVIISYWMIPFSYLFALAMVARRWWTGRLDNRSWFLLASALVGLACLHQAMHRMDPGHLIQAVPAAIVCVSLFASELLRGDSALGLPAWQTPWIRAAGIAYAILLVALGLKLSRWGQVDLEEFTFWPRERYAALAHPIGHSNRDPRAHALRAVTKLTGPSDPILVFPIDPQFYALTQRRISGRLHAYYGGVFDSPQACADNLLAVQADMPQLVVVRPDFAMRPEMTVDPLTRKGRLSHQYLEGFIRKEYPRVVLNEGGIMVLGRGSGLKISR